MNIQHRASLSLLAGATGSPSWPFQLWESGLFPVGSKKAGVAEVGSLPPSPVLTSLRGAEGLLTCFLCGPPTPTPACGEEGPSDLHACAQAPAARSVLGAGGLQRMPEGMA